MCDRERSIQTIWKDCNKYSKTDLESLLNYSQFTNQKEFQQCEVRWCIGNYCITSNYLNRRANHHGIASNSCVLFEFTLRIFVKIKKSWAHLFTFKISMGMLHFFCRKIRSSRRNQMLVMQNSTSWIAFKIFWSIWMESIFKTLSVFSAQKIGNWSWKLVIE